MYGSLCMAWMASIVCTGSDLAALAFASHCNALALVGSFSAHRQSRVSDCNVLALSDCVVLHCICIALGIAIDWNALALHAWLWSTSSAVLACIASASARLLGYGAGTVAACIALAWLQLSMALANHSNDSTHLVCIALAKHMLCGVILQSSACLVLALAKHGWLCMLGLYLALHSLVWHQTNANHCP